MCGITLCISKTDKQNAVNHVLNSLFQLQNRGYDSFGISYFDCENNIFKIIKKAQNMNSNSSNDLFDDFSTICKPFTSNMAIGHSRWATHGMINDVNAHPHISNNNTFICVHNGIIENFQELKNELIENEYYFSSKTDTEVIVNLIDYHYEKMSKEKDTYKRLCDSILLATQQLSGTYGLIVMNNILPDNVFLIKNGSPLLVGDSGDCIYASSELCGFDNKIKNYIEVDNKSLIVLSCKNGIEIVSGKINTQKEICSQLLDQYMTKDLGIYNHYTQKEIYEQSDTLMMSLSNGARISNGSINLGGLQQLKSYMNDIEHIVFLGCGSSYYAGQIGMYYLKETIHNNSDIFGNVNVWCFDAGDFEEKLIPRGGLCLFILVSQSGETMDIIKHLPMLKSNNHKTMGIINVIDSTIAKEVDCGVYMNIGREVAVASTKSFNSSLLIMKLFSLWYLQEKTKNNNSKKIDEYIKLSISNLHKLIYQVKYLNEHIDLILDDFNIDILSSDNVFVLGRDKYQYIAQECALKMKEICYIHAEGYSANSLKHGPLALIQPGFPIILLINLYNFDKMMNTYEEVQSRGANVIIITSINNESVLHLKGQHNTKIIQIPENSFMNEIITMITIQHICYKLSCFREINPDKPKNLAKVVTVE